MTRPGIRWSRECEQVLSKKGQGMKHDPSIIRLSPEWVRDLNSIQCGLPDGRYVPARPHGYSSLRERLRAAWLVWTGRADALIWPGQ